MNPETETLREQLTAALEVSRWVDDVMRLGPFASAAALRAAAKRAFPLSHDELTVALGTHPRIGERAQGTGRAAEFSDAEQSASQSSDGALDAVLRAGNEEYEAKFGHVFLIRAAGRSRQEIVEQLQERLRHSASEEVAATARELEEITMLRVDSIAERLYGGGLDDDK